MSEGAWAWPLGWQGLQVDQTQRVGLPQAYPGTVRLESPCPSCAFQHYSDERHSHGGPPERHARDSRDGWGGYGSDKRMSEGRGPPPPPRLAGRPRQASLGASLPSLGFCARDPGVCAHQLTWNRVSSRGDSPYCRPRLLKQVALRLSEACPLSVVEKLHSALCCRVV